MLMSLRLRRSPLVLLTTLLALLLALSACGGTTGAAGSAAGDNAVATGGDKFSTADAETAKLGSDAEPGVFPRTVVHANGSTEITAKPQRIVVLDTGELDAVVSLGFTPVGITTTEGVSSAPSYLADQVAGATTVGTISEPNLEAIAALEPDLILGSKLRVDKLYPQLSEIAPTVFSIRPGFPWKENFLLAGEALGEETKATATLNAYQESADALRAKISGDPTISLVRFMPGRLRLYTNMSLIGVILKDVGLKRAEGQDVDDLAVEISPEEIAKAEGDVIFWTSYGDPGASGETSVIEGTAWKNLGAVKAGKAQRVNDDVWFLGLGPTGATLVLADLETYLAD